MNFELELLILFALQTVGFAVFRKFEIETLWWRSILKWFLVMGITYTIYNYTGHWAIVFIVSISMMGLGIHFTWCKMNQIHPLNATPRKKYYALRKWHWKE